MASPQKTTAPLHRYSYQCLSLDWAAIDRQEASPPVRIGRAPLTVRSVGRDLRSKFDDLRIHLNEVYDTYRIESFHHARAFTRVESKMRIRFLVQETMRMPM